MKNQPPERDASSPRLSFWWTRWNNPLLYHLGHMQSALLCFPIIICIIVCITYICTYTLYSFFDWNMMSPKLFWDLKLNSSWYSEAWGGISRRSILGWWKQRDVPCFKGKRTIKTKLRGTTRREKFLSESMPWSFNMQAVCTSPVPAVTLRKAVSGCCINKYTRG